MSLPNKIGRVHNGLKIARFMPGSKRSVLSAETANELVDPINALLSLRVVRGSSDSVSYSDRCVVITVKFGG